MKKPAASSCPDRSWAEGRAGAHSDWELFCNSSTPPAGPFPMIIPKIFVRESLKVPKMPFRLVRALEQSQLY